MDDKWFLVEVWSAPELTDGIANFLEEIGAAGVYQEAALETAGQSCPEEVKVLDYGPLMAWLAFDLREEGIALLEGYLDSLGEIFPNLTKPSFRIREITASNWGEEWKEYFHPARIGRRFIVKPTWEEYTPQPGDLVIEIDPGMAFGTGQHPSTAMCIEAMEEIYSCNDTSNWDVLDLGTGTGVLGIAAACLGTGQVLCLDIDEKALEIARANAWLNKVDGKIDITNLDVSSLARSFNLILANLTAKTLIRHRGTLASLLKGSGYLVLSGIIRQNRTDIEACFLRPPFRLCWRIEREEWFCYVLTKSE